MPSTRPALLFFLGRGCSSWLRSSRVMLRIGGWVTVSRLRAEVFPAERDRLAVVATDQKPERLVRHVEADFSGTAVGHDRDDVGPLRIDSAQVRTRLPDRPIEV